MEDLIVGAIVISGATAIKVITKVTGDLLTMNHIEWTDSPLNVVSYELLMTATEVDRLITKEVFALSEETSDVLKTALEAAATPVEPEEG